jgi:hypothetical protein
MGETHPVGHTVPMTTMPPQPPQPVRSGPPRDWRRAVLVTLAVFTAAGAVGGWIWQQFAPLARYTVDAEGATLAEEEMTRVFGPDGTFVSIGFAGALVLGGVLFWWLHDHGPWTVPLVVLGSALASGVAWGVGTLLSPDDFDERLAAAKPGDLLPASLELHAWSALAAWPVGAALATAVIAAITWRNEPQEQPPATDGPPPASQSPWM